MHVYFINFAGRTIYFCDRLPAILVFLARVCRGRCTAEGDLTDRVALAAPLWQATGPPPPPPSLLSHSPPPTTPTILPRVICFYRRSVVYTDTFFFGKLETWLYCYATMGFVEIDEHSHVELLSRLTELGLEKNVARHFLKALVAYCKRTDLDVRDILARLDRDAAAAIEAHFDAFQLDDGCPMSLVLSNFFEKQQQSALSIKYTPGNNGAGVSHDDADGGGGGDDDDDDDDDNNNNNNDDGETDVTLYDEKTFTMEMLGDGMVVHTTKNSFNFIIDARFLRGPRAESRVARNTIDILKSDAVLFSSNATMKSYPPLSPETRPVLDPAKVHAFIIKTEKKIKTCMDRLWNPIVHRHRLMVTPRLLRTFVESGLVLYYKCLMVRDTELILVDLHTCGPTATHDFLDRLLAEDLVDAETVEIHYTTALVNRHLPISVVNEMRFRYKFLEATGKLQPVAETRHEYDVEFVMRLQLEIARAYDSDLNASRHRADGPLLSVVTERGIQHSLDACTHSKRYNFFHGPTSMLFNMPCENNTQASDMCVRIE